MRSRLRRWRKELIYTAVVAAICFPFRGGTTGFAVMMGFSGFLWWMGWSHKNEPLMETVRELYGMIRKLLDAKSQPDGQARPKLTVHRGGKGA